MPCIWMKNFAKAKVRVSLIQIYSILWCNFLYVFAIADTGLSPAPPLIGLILVKERRVGDLHLSALAVIKCYSVQGRWILKDISDPLNCVKCVCPSIQWDAVCVCWLMKQDWNVIDRAALRITFFYWRHLCYISVNVFASKTSIHTIYTSQGSLSEHLLRAYTHKHGSKVGLPPPCHLPLFPTQFPRCKWSHVELNTYG